MESRTERAVTTTGPEVDPRTRLALWLRGGRVQRNLSIDDVARITKIQARILEKLEAGRIDGLPADVFVRGFVRSFARCVGLDEGEALRRYGLATGTHDLTPTVRALVEVMSDLAPDAATAARATPRKMHAVEVIDLAPMTPEPSALATTSETDDAAAVTTPVAASARSEEHTSELQSRFGISYA